MKRTFFKRTWVRRVAQSVAVTVSLLWLAVAAFNWWAARERERVAQELVREGLHVTHASLLAQAPPMPPDELNFAKIPLLAALSEVGPEADQARAALTSMGVLERGMGFKPRSQDQDFKKWGKLLNCAGDARSCLKRYDELNGTALRELHDGLTRSHAQSDWFRQMLGQDGGIIQVFARCQYLARNAIGGLAARAHMALAAGEPDIALESLAIGYRMAELVGSNEGAFAEIHKTFACRQLRSPLRAGLEAGAWDAQQLQKLDAILARIEFSKDVSRSVDFYYCGRLWSVDDLKRNPGQMIYSVPIKVPVVFRHPAWQYQVEKQVRRLVPDGWFDLYATRLMQVHRRHMAELKASPTLAVWWTNAWEDRSKQSKTEPKPPHWYELERRVAKEEAHCAYIPMDRCRNIVALQQDRVAIELARYRLAHGSYPAALADIGGEVIIDPSTQQPFAYELKDDGYRLSSTLIDADPQKR